jgi:hypothetical protein
MSDAALRQPRRERDHQERCRRVAPARPSTPRTSDSSRSICAAAARRRGRAPRPRWWTRSRRAWSRELSQRCAHPGARRSRGQPPGRGSRAPGRGGATGLPRGRGAAGRGRPRPRGARPARRPRPAAGGALERCVLSARRRSAPALERELAVRSALGEFHRARRAPWPSPRPPLPTPRRAPSSIPRAGAWCCVYDLPPSAARPATSSVIGRRAHQRRRSTSVRRARRATRRARCRHRRPGDDRGHRRWFGRIRPSRPGRTCWLGELTALRGLPGGGPVQRKTRLAAPSRERCEAAGPAERHASSSRYGRRRQTVRSNRSAWLA